jgi:hypothetical protein
MNIKAQLGHMTATGHSLEFGPPAPVEGWRPAPCGDSQMRVGPAWFVFFPFGQIWSDKS